VTIDMTIATQILRQTSPYHPSVCSFVLMVQTILVTNRVITTGIGASGLVKMDMTIATLESGTNRYELYDRSNGSDRGYSKTKVRYGSSTMEIYRALFRKL
jgi:hypothetical protein